MQYQPSFYRGGHYNTGFSPKENKPALLNTVYGYTLILNEYAHTTGTVSTSYSKFPSIFRSGIDQPQQRFSA